MEFYRSAGERQSKHGDQHIHPEVLQITLLPSACVLAMLRKTECVCFLQHCNVSVLRYDPDRTSSIWKRCASTKTSPSQSGKRGRFRMSIMVCYLKAGSSKAKAAAYKWHPCLAQSWGAMAAHVSFALCWHRLQLPRLSHEHSDSSFLEGCGGD